MSVLVVPWNPREVEEKAVEKKGQEKISLGVDELVDWWAPNFQEPI